MKHIRIPFLVVALSLTLTGMAFAIDIPLISTWTTGFGCTPAAPCNGTTITGIGGGGPGRGDVLLGPLYDCRDLTDPNLPGLAGTTARSQQTLISIVNTHHLYGVVGRIRFKEWKRSIEVLDFDIPLTSNDVWVAQVSRVSTGGCVLTSPDMYISSGGTAGGMDPFIASVIPAGGFAFNPLLITDGDANPIARTEYGDFEFIGEELFSALTANGTVNRLTPGVVLGGIRDVPNVLEGTVYIVRPDVAISHQYNMTAIANFAIEPTGIWASTAYNIPTLYSAVQGGPNPAAPANVGAGGFDNLEALLSKRFVDFQYVNGGQIGGLPVGGTTPMSTSLVISFPTKERHYTHGNVYPALADPVPGPGVYPYRIPFTGAREVLGDETRSTATIIPLGTQDAGEVVECTIWDRLEHVLSPPTTPISPSRTPLCRLPWQVNVIGVYPSETISANTFRNNWLIPTASGAAGQTFYSGWGRVDLSPPLAFSTSDTRTVRQGNGLAVRGNPIVFNFFNNFFTEYYGLPAIGIVMSEFYNDTVAGYYGNTVPWQYGADWACATCVPAIAHNPADPPNPR